MLGDKVFFDPRAGTVGVSKAQHSLDVEFLNETLNLHCAGIEHYSAGAGQGVAVAGLAHGSRVEVDVLFITPLNKAMSLAKGNQVEIQTGKFGELRIVLIEIIAERIPRAAMDKQK